MNKQNASDLICNVDYLLKSLKDRGYGNRERLFRKMIEEAGEYGEAIEYYNGATRKVKKFQGKDAKEMLREEISDLVMVGLALASLDDLGIEDVLTRIKNKLERREEEHRRTAGLPEYIPESLRRKE